MKNLLIVIVCMCFSVSGSSQITAAEYYIDTDNLGVGNQNQLPVTVGNTIDENFSIQTTGLAEGLHTLHIRAKGTSDIWSLYKRAYFYVQTPTSNGIPQNITAAEYYIDTDASGVGNYLPLIVTSGMTINETFPIPTTGLADGLHVLHIRAKDADDTWSLYKRAYFYVQTPTTNGTPKNIVAAEYYIDTDVSGVGGNQTLGAFTPGMAISEVFTIPTTGLTDGLHVLHIRVKDADNTWSLYKRAYFYTHSPNSTATAKPISEAEYFFDSDPGISNANAIALTPGLNVDEVFPIQVPLDMIDGDHILHIRVKDEDNNWSLYKRELFTVDASLSVEDFDDENLKVFPNPTHRVLNIRFKNLSKYSIKIFDMNGKELIHKTNMQLNNTVNFSNYAKGVYMLQISNDKEVSTKTLKVIKS